MTKLAKAMSNGVWPSKNNRFSNLNSSTQTYDALNLPPKAPASHLNDLMQGVAKEVNDHLSSELLRIAKLKPGNAERDMHPIFIKHGLELSVKVSLLNFGFIWIHVVRMSSWFAYALEHKPSVLLAGFPTASRAAMDTLRSFWESYRFEEPDHEIYKIHSNRLDRCIPYFMFSDDGRGLKKSKLLVISFETPFGRETASHWNEFQRGAKKPKKSCGASNNMNGTNGPETQSDNGRLNSFLTRFLYGVVPSGSYTDNVYTGLLHDIAKDCNKLFMEGVEVGSQRWFGVCLGAKGDAPAQHKSGFFTRSFYHDSDDGGPICPHCLAGTDGYPYSDTSKQAAWRQTVWASRPWATPSPLAIIATEACRPEVFYKGDPFHTFKLGLGRYFLASAIICLGQWKYFTTDEEGHSVPSFFAAAYKDFRFFAKKELRRGSINIRAFTREKFHFTDHDTFPMGGWKASDTILLLKWMLVFLEKGANPDEHVPREGRGPLYHPIEPWQKWFLQAIHDAATAAVKSFNMIHCGRLWLTRVESRALIDDIQLFCAAYSALARRSYEQKLCRFPIQPVLHAWQHNAVRMESVLARGSPFVLNPYAHMNDRNEDFLGHVSRISRRVSGRTTSQRTLQRSLIRFSAEWMVVD